MIKTQRSGLSGAAGVRYSEADLVRSHMCHKNQNLYQVTPWIHQAALAEMKAHAKFVVTVVSVGSKTGSKMARKWLENIF